MPTITDATVVSGSGYSTEGNGGRKLVRLNDGTLYAVMKKSTGWLIRKSTDGINWVTFREVSDSIVYSDIALSTDGTRVFVLRGVRNSSSSSLLSFTSYDALGNPSNSTSVDISQTAIGNVSLAINEAKTELHAAWASKNSTYPNTFNIRYAKGTINENGTITWGAVEQISSYNESGVDYKSPSIVVKADGYPAIFSERTATPSGIRAWYKTSGGWSNKKTVYDGDTYTQSSPSAIFVPQSVNGLANGRIWVTWRGTDNTDANNYQIRVTYSDDSGLTWSSMNKLTSESKSQVNPSITFNKNNDGFIVFDGWDTKDLANDIKMVRYSNNSWSAVEMIAEGTTGSKAYASTLLDLTLDFSFPLFIYKDLQNSKVGFYGTGVVTTISVTPGDIGQKTDKNNILSYSITTDGEMSTITEKINGTVVNTRNTTSGQAVQLGLTQSQWDAIRFGKYADATGGKNTLTVEMGGEKWNYTFDKRLATDADILSSVKAIKDVNETHLPSIKKSFVDVINDNGGSVEANSSIEQLITSVGQLIGSMANTPTGKKYATILANVPGGDYVISGLNFKPSIFIFIEGSLTENFEGFFFGLRNTATNTTLGYLSASHNNSNYLANSIEWGEDSITLKEKLIGYLSTSINCLIIE